MKLLDYNGKTHPSKCIVPPGTRVDNIHEQIVTINKEYGCNLINRTILFPLVKVKSDDDPNQIAYVFVYFNSNKNIVVLILFRLPVVMFNGYKIKNDSRSKRGATANDKAIQTTSDFIENEIGKICKLRITMCRLIDSGELECISQYLDTDLIKEST